jgi:hypothetical protein
VQGERRLGCAIILLEGHGQGCTCPTSGKGINGVITFIQFLEEIERSHRTVVIEGAEVERLVENFGPEVRGMGVWNHGTDGSLEIPMSNITDAVRKLDDQVLAEAVTQLKTPEHFTDLLNTSSAAKQLIEALSKTHLQQFQHKVERYQDSTDPTAVERLRDEISRELFGR